MQGPTAIGGQRRCEDWRALQMKGFQALDESMSKVGDGSLRKSDAEFLLGRSLDFPPLAMLGKALEANPGHEIVAGGPSRKEPFGDDP
ncbi:MAG: hypothetical protein Q8N51_04625, partial [Gammaproteobacteria bacterium]|nr:hypothetical protein [Gammaproteobacteria bacterium]